MAAQATPFVRDRSVASEAASHRAMVAGGVVAVVSLVLAALTVAGGMPPYADTGIVVGVALSLAGIAILGHGVAVSEPERVPWKLVGGGVLAGGAGFVVRTAAGVGSGSSDVFGLAMAVAVSVGLLRLPHLRASRFGQIRIVFDATAGVCATAVLARVMGGSVVDPLATVPPLVLAGATMLVALRQSVWLSDVQRRLVVVAAAVTSVLWLVVGSEPAWWWISVVAFACVGWATGRDRTRSRDIVARPARTGLATVYVPVIGLLAVAVWTLSKTGSISSELGAGLAAVMAAMAGRTWAGVRENRRLVELERDQLLASMSHELRTPLTAVAGFAELLTASWHKLTDDEGREMSEIVYRQATRLVDLVTDMAALARSELDAVAVELEQVDGKSIVNRALVDVFEGDLTGWKVRAEVEPYVAVLADGRRLRQMLVALVENAKSYGRGSILVVVRRSRGDRVIEVHDDGHGVPARHERRIWERFERGAHELDAAIPGAGLGLTRVRDLATAHGGTAEYRRSERLGGACFTVTLPYD